jgi:hypothetical protein
VDQEKLVRGNSSEENEPDNGMEAIGIRKDIPLDAG